MVKVFEKRGHVMPTTRSQAILDQMDTAEGSTFESAITDPAPKNEHDSNASAANITNTASSTTNTAAAQTGGASQQAGGISPAGSTASGAADAANKPPIGPATGWIIMNVPPEKRDAALRDYARQLELLEEHKRKRAGVASAGNTSSDASTPTRTTPGTTAAVDEATIGAQRGWVRDVPAEKKDHRALRDYARQLDLLEEQKRRWEAKRGGGVGRGL